MKRSAVLAIAALLVLATSSADAQRIRAHATLTVTNGAAVAFGALTPAGNVTDPAINFATLTVETASVRWWDDGTAPTVAAGHLANAGGTIVLNNHDNVVNFKVIATTATNASVVGSFGRP